MRPTSVGTAVRAFSLGQSYSWPDPDIEGTLVVSEPSADPELWAEYTAGAVRSYSKRGVESALDLEALRTGSDTIMFGAVVADSGHVVGGYRAIALGSSADSHAVEEWAGQPGQHDVRRMIDERVPYGVLEMKSGWVTDAAGRNPLLTTALARSCFYMMVMLDFQYTMCTAAVPVLNSWRSSGSVVAPIPATPYPSEHYRTKMMWWNRRDFVSHAKPNQLTKIVSETKDLLHEQFRRGPAAADITSLVPSTPAQLVLADAFEVA
ncbi:hypothetical protein PT015_20370 [Candidatus Mycobacterium wuenschmannii]|uniref:Uncharacterized protein n=1 Tax=Candidatus Mycobacterium wuenschmannii TaxID=3027808 RepID=A0ABY8W0A1_9MYCO|nr:hypothetical protein [Candidatus Mycobacterium wuenschmannii]WIM87189.1 hypothetical protein PT015_20370 [Candidatus Mycobacterium wuenschmannii]